jgi:hypothetical protein
MGREFEEELNAIAGGRWADGRHRIFRAPAVSQSGETGISAVIV